MYIITVDGLYLNSIEYAKTTNLGSKKNNKIITSITLFIDYKDSYIFKSLHEAQKVKNKIKLFDHRIIEIKELTASEIST